MKTNQSTHMKANLALGISIIVLSFSGFFVRWADAPGPITSLFRMAFTAFFLSLYIFRNKSSFKLSFKKIIFPLLAGILISLDQYFWSSALEFTTIANSILLAYIAPVWVALISFILFKQKMSRKFWLGLSLTMIGTMAIFGNDLFNHPQINRGDIMAFFASFFYAGFFLLSEKGRLETSVAEFLWLVTLSGTFTLTVLALINGSPLIGYNNKTILIFIGAALFAQLIGYLALAYASGHLPASIISPTMILHPVLAAILAIPISGEPITKQLLLAAPLILFGIYLINHQTGSIARSPS
ncbi:MAG: DMT family transporter [Anaerolineaceae bacterium]|nr:DMT family transporter [Anaerolineaceae bacterium]